MPLGAWGSNWRRRWPMTDDFESFESELLAMRPRAVSAELQQRLEKTLGSSPRGGSDRLLLFSMTLGALAACVSTVLLFGQPTFSPSMPTPEPTRLVAKNERFRQSMQTTIAMS